MRFAKLFLSLIAALAICQSAFAEMPILEPEATLPPRIYEIDSANTIGNKAEITAKLFNGDNEPLDSFDRLSPIHFSDPESFSQLEGITTFRGGNFRDRAAWGDIGGEPKEMNIVWQKRIGGIDNWSGVGWTGQCSIVRWPTETVAIMNISSEKKTKPGLTEVIYATLDGHIYFLDLDDGAPTREPIDIGAPIKGSVSIDPRGWPLLYCGQGIPEVHGKAVPIGTRIFSLIDSSVLYFIDGRDKAAQRHWYAFDCAPLIDGATDTMLQLGENGIFYSVSLNTNYDQEAGTISVDPKTVKYVYTSPASNRLGMENSLAAFSHYGYFAENSGLIQCVDLNTMELVWSCKAGDDTDSTIVLEKADNGAMALYTACELDLQGSSGYCHIRRLDPLTGQQAWIADVPCKTSGDTNGGAFATPAPGKGGLSEYLYIQVARTKDGGTLFCIDKNTGEIAWQESLKCYGWSSPVCVYSRTGRGYVLVAGSSGIMRLFDGLTGEIVCSVDLGSNVEGSPAVFGNTVVVGTRGQKIFGIEFE